MGVTYSLQLIEPATFFEAVGDLEAHPFANVDDVSEYLKRHHCTDDASLLNGFEDAFTTNDKKLSQFAYNSLLKSVVTSRDWYLDKSLSSHALEKPLTTFPELAPVRFLVAFTGWDINVPTSLYSDSGLYGLWSAATLQPACDVVQRFETQDNARQLLPIAKRSFIDRIFRRTISGDAALDAWITYWDFWQEVRSAIIQTVDRGWALGYSMYP